MRILHIIASLEIGGAQRLLSEILPLMAQDHEVTLLVNEGVDNDFSHRVKFAGIRVITTNDISLHSPRNIIAIRRLMKGYDVVHVHLFPMLYWASIAARFTSIRLVYTEHSTSNRRRNKWYFRPLERLIYSRYQRVISISQQTQDALTRWLGIKQPHHRFVVINNGVNLSTFPNLHQQRDYPHTLIMVSRFVASKDQQTVIRAMGLLPNDVHVVFVGDGEEMERCQEVACSLGLDNRVHFVGSQSDVASWIAKADIGIQSSNWEGFGLTAVELMAAGKPVIATNVDGLKQVVEGAGLLFDVGDEKTLANYVSQLLQNEVLYMNTAEKCIHRAQLYDINNTVANYLKVYSELDGQKKM